MTKILSILFYCFLPFILFGQVEKNENKRLADSFEKNYNSDNFQAIFDSCSNDMQMAIPFEKLSKFLLATKKQAGNIKKREFIRYKQTYAQYKTVFEKALLEINISIDKDAKINGLFIEPINLPKIERNTTKLILPFKNEWTVTWGGDTKELNYHVENAAQKNAFDFVIKDKNDLSYQADGKKNEDYFAFDKEIIAPCNGQVVLVVDGIKDNIPGVLNPFYIPGNTVLIKTANNEFMLFAHFKQNSIKVKQNQMVKQGELLGKCGNSGNSTEPHLHFHIQNIEDLTQATGVKCYFEQIFVNGEIKTDYSPIKTEKVRNRN